MPPVRVVSLSAIRAPSAVAAKPTTTDIIFGFHSVRSRLSREPDSIIEVLYDAQRKDKRATQLKLELDRMGVPHRAEGKKRLAQLSGQANHQGVVALVKPARQKPEAALYELLDSLDHMPLLLVLDQVQDPHNLGACLRSADGAGVDAVILPKDGACPVNDTVRRVASGAAETVPVFYVSNLARTLKNLQERQIWLTGLADEASQDFFKADLCGRSAIVMGAEGKGLRRLTREHCDHLISIPMMGSVSSLNVSVATGVVLFEALRQRKENEKT